MTGNDRIDQLEKLDLNFSAFHLNVEIDWVRAIRHLDVPNHEWHSHGNMEIHFLLEGSLHYSFEDSTFDIMAGEALLIPPNTLHKLGNMIDSPYFSFILNIRLTPETDDPEALFFSNALKIETPRQIALYDGTIQLLRRCLQEAGWRTNGFLIAIQSSLLIILADVAREIQGAHSAKYAIAQKRNMASMRAERILEYIEHACNRPITVDDLAQYMYLSPRQVQRIVNEAYGTSIGGLIKSARIKRAKELLKNSALSVNSISEMVGFATPQAFCRFFLREEGLSPSRWREGILPSKMK